MKRAIQKLFLRARLKTVVGLFGDAQIFRRLSQCRVESQRFLVFNDRLRSFAFTQQQAAVVAVDVGSLWLEPNRFSVVRFGVFQISLREERSRNLRVCVRHVRIDIESAAVLNERAVNVASFIEESPVSV